MLNRVMGSVFQHASGTVLAVWMLTGCSTHESSAMRQPAQPEGAVQISVAKATQVELMEAGQASVQAPVPITMQTRYQCQAAKGKEWLVVTYQAQTPAEASVLTLQRGEAHWQFSRAPLLGTTLFLADEEGRDYRWLVADSGLASLRVRAPTRSAIETAVLTECQPIALTP